jgi:hypothetical protein
LGGYPQGGTLQGGTEHFEMAFTTGADFQKISACRALKPTAILHCDTVH